MAQTLREIYNQTPEQIRDSYFLAMMRSIREIWGSQKANTAPHNFSENVWGTHWTNGVKFLTTKPTDKEATELELALERLEESWGVWANAVVQEGILWQQLEKEMRALEAFCWDSLATTIAAESTETTPDGRDRQSEPYLDLFD